MQKTRRVLFCLVATLVLGLVMPIRLLAADLYVGETAVADEDSETRNAALSRLLADVLIRVSGNTGIAALPAAKPVLAAAPSLVQQYRYRTATEGEAVERFLWARFDQGGVERMLRQQGLPVWTQRPRVLLWLATEQGAQRALLNLDSRPEALAALRSRADYRGMPLQLPLMDLEDQAQLTPADVWSDYQAGIRQASARYPHDLVVTGRLSAGSGNKWRGVWSMLGRDGAQQFETPAQSLADALMFAVDQIQNQLAARYAPMPGVGGSGTLVRFADVYDLPAYGRLVGYLEGMAVVARAALRDVRGDAVTFELHLRGDDDDLRRALEGGSVVAAEPGGRPARRLPGRDDATGPATVPAANTAPRADLYYRLLN